jgi:RHS repeat-associated protein
VYIGQEFGYTGRRHDVEDTELMYFRARYYSGELGRFVSRDPLMYVDGMSLYSSYFHVNGVDPSGMFSGGGGQWMGGNPGWNPGCHSTFHGIKSPGIFEDFVKRAIPRLVKIKKTIRVIKWTSCGPVVVLTTVTVYALVWGGKTPPTCNQFQMKYNPKYYMNQKSG